MRTGLTSLCPSCALRVESTRVVCPSCGEPGLVDLRDGGAALRVQPAQTAAPVPRPRYTGLPVIGASITAVVTAAFILSLPTNGFAALFPIWFAMVFLPPLVFVGLAAYERARAQRPPAAAPTPPQMTAPLRFEATAADGSVHVQGRVRARETVASPLRGRPCVAYRVAGDVGGATIDDAVLVAFDVVTADGEVVAVPPGAAAVALALPDASVVRRSDELDALLAERGAPNGIATLAEAILADGDEVSVDGAVQDHDVPDGLRGTRVGRAIVEGVDVPRIVRLVRAVTGG